MKLATYVRKFKDRSGNYIVPATRSTGVYLSNNQTLQKWIDNMEDEKFNLLTVYPVGAIFQSTSNTSPASLFGGNWEKFTNRFLVGAGGLYSVNSMGGEDRHTLNINEMPKHQHVGSDSGYSFLVDLNKNIVSNEFAMLTSSSNSYKYSVNNGTAFTGGTQPHNNMPPYYAVNIWRRTA